METNDTGGLPDDVAAEIKQAARRRRASPTRPVPRSRPAPTGGELHRGCCAPGQRRAGRRRSTQPMLAEDLGVRPAPEPTAARAHRHRRRDHRRRRVRDARRDPRCARPGIASRRAGEEQRGRRRLVGEHAIPAPASTPPATCTPTRSRRATGAPHFGKRDEVSDYLRDVADDARPAPRASAFGTEVTGAAWDDDRRALGRVVRHRRRRTRSPQRGLLICAVGAAQPPEGARPPRARHVHRPALPLRPAGPTTSTSPAAASPSSGPGPARCRSCPPSPGTSERITVFQRSPAVDRPERRLLRADRRRPSTA